MFRSGPRSIVALACAAPRRAIARSLPEAAPNTNRKSAGRLSHDTLFVSLEARVRRSGAPMRTRARRSRSRRSPKRARAPSIPGPLIRVREGTRDRRDDQERGRRFDARDARASSPHPAAKDDTVQVTARRRAHRHLQRRRARHLRLLGDDHRRGHDRSIARGARRAAGRRDRGGSRHRPHRRRPDLRHHADRPRRRLARSPSRTTSASRSRSTAARGRTPSVSRTRRATPSACGG